jgi:hypothetical protein
MWRELDGPFDSLPEKLKPRIFLTLGPRRFSDPDLIAPKASALLLTLLSSELFNRDSGTYGWLLYYAPENIDRRAMTDKMIESLRHMKYRRSWGMWSTISRIVKYLNLWHDLDIGGLGTDVRKKTPDLDKMDLEAIAAEAVKWYDTVYKGAHPNAVR